MLDTGSLELMQRTFGLSGDPSVDPVDDQRSQSQQQESAAPSVQQSYYSSAQQSRAPSPTVSERSAPPPPPPVPAPAPSVREEPSQPTQLQRLSDLRRQIEKDLSALSFGGSLLSTVAAEPAVTLSARSFQVAVSMKQAVDPPVSQVEVQPEPTVRPPVIPTVPPEAPPSPVKRPPVSVLAPSLARLAQAPAPAAQQTMAHRLLLRWMRSRLPFSRAHPSHRAVVTASRVLKCCLLRFPLGKDRAFA